MNSRMFETRTSFPPFSKGLRIPSMADDDWTDESRFASRSGDCRNGFDFESFIPLILRHHAPIEWDREAGGYRFVKPDSAAPVYKLPGLWFSPRERMSSPRRRGSNLLESVEHVW